MFDITALSTSVKGMPIPFIIDAVSGPIPADTTKAETPSDSGLARPRVATKSSQTA